MFWCLQNVSFAPPEGFMDVDTSASVGSRSPGGSKSPTAEPAMSALQEVAASLANVKGAIKSGAADRNRVIDMLTNLLRETLQVQLLPPGLPQGPLLTKTRSGS